MVIFQIQHSQIGQVSKLFRYLTSYAISLQLAELQNKNPNELVFKADCGNVPKVGTKNENFQVSSNNTI